MGGTKALSLDSFSGWFYQSNWDLLGSELCNMVHSFYSQGYLLKEINRTNIVLIPKYFNPITLAQYKPITLCNFVYKVISKTVVNHLKLWMNSLILLNQTTFIPSRAI